MIAQDMKSYVGIDVSKDILDVFILPCRKYMQFKNDDKGVKKACKKLSLYPQVSIVMEASGGYEKLATQALQNAALSVSVVNPRQIRDFAKALGRLAKTDQIDAEVIALFAEKIQPKPSIMQSKNQKQLVETNARRRQLVDMITQEKNRLDKASTELKKSILRVIKVLEKELEAINQNLEEAIEADHDSARKSRLLRSIKGVGPIVAAGMVAEMPELGTLGPRQISALAGLAPYNRDSGTLRGKRTTWGGRASVRVLVYMATLSAIRYNAQIKTCYQRLCRAGKSKMVAIVACMRKLLIVMSALIRKNEPWREPAVV